MRLSKKAFLMCSASHQPSNNLRARLIPVVAGSAKRDQIFECIRLAYGPRNNVVNVQPFSFPCQRSLWLSAGLAPVPVSDPRSIGLSLPVCAPAIVSGSSAFPLGAFFAGKRPVARCYVARVTAELSHLASKMSEILPAVITASLNTLCAVPPMGVIASHRAKDGAIGSIGGNTEALATTGAGFISFGRSPIRTGFGAAVPGWATVRPRASMAAISAISPASKSSSALNACVVNWLCHAGDVARTRINYKYFDMACKRVDEATRQPDMFVQAPPPAPTQESLL